MKIAVIPARGGSKRIPRKNIKTFNGRPMIAWSINAALESACFDRVVVSTDDDDIAAIAKECGAEVPFMRPASLSDDYCGTSEVVAHAIEWFSGQQTGIQFACCIYATAPFIRADDLRQSLACIEESTADYCFSVTSYAFPIQRAIRVTEAKRCEMFTPEMFDERSQDLEAAYHDAGQFYWGRPEAWNEIRPIFSENAIPFIIPRHRVQDIDTPEDWERAELMIQALL